MNSEWLITPLQVQLLITSSNQRAEILFLESNLSLQSQLYALRAETQKAFDEAKALETRWRELEKEQKELYQVHSVLAITIICRLITGFNN